jgi:hypothetical protein
VLDEDIIIPVVMFGGLTIVMCLFFWFRYRSRADAQQTIRMALDKGLELSPELVDSLGQPRSSKDRDLRLAIIWLALAAGLVLIGFAVPGGGTEALRGTLAGAAFPFVIGIAYVIMWRFTDRQ